jgi:hypothetical protein
VIYYTILAELQTSFTGLMLEYWKINIRQGNEKNFEENKFKAAPEHEIQIQHPFPMYNKISEIHASV